MIVKDLADSFHRSGRKAFRELTNRNGNAGDIGISFIGHEPAQAIFVPGLEFFQFGKMGVQYGHDHKNGVSFIHNFFVRMTALELSRLRKVALSFHRWPAA